MKIENSRPSFSTADLALVENTINCQLPSDYRKFLLAYNGGKPDTRRFSTANGKITSSVMDFFPITNDAETGLLSEIQGITISKLIPKNLIPIAIDPIENRLLISISPDDFGAIYYWAWDEEPDPETCSYQYITIIANSFSEFINMLHS